MCTETTAQRYLWLNRHAVVKGIQITSPSTQRLSLTLQRLGRKWTYCWCNLKSGNCDPQKIEFDLWILVASKARVNVIPPSSIEYSPAVGLVPSLNALAIWAKTASGLERTGWRRMKAESRCFKCQK